MIDLPLIPNTPGCYLFSDESGTIIYVGKAKDLRKRVTSYFQKTDHGAKTRLLVEQIASLDFMVTGTETEALLLENNLIKKHQPKYNIDLKDAKRFAYIEISRDEFPRIGIARQKTRGAVYYGPFVSAAERDAVLRVIKRTFLLRSCRKLPKRACLRYYMHSCSAPCIGAIYGEEYRTQVGRAAALLRGKRSALIQQLREEMAACSAGQEYEKALSLRNQIAAIERLSERQYVERPKESDQDVIAYTVAEGTVSLMLFAVRKGSLVQKQEYSFEAGDDFFEEFLIQYYADHPPPAEIILPSDIDTALNEYLTAKRGKTVHVTVPKIGEKKKLLDLAYTNIELSYRNGALKTSELQAALDLADSPHVIESFDISHLSGTAMVGSMVQFRDGAPDKKNYRRFRIRNVEGIDDVASIGEVVKRRYQRLSEEGSDLPDLIVIDGGKGQLSAARNVLINIGVEIPVIALAKREEVVYLHGELLPRRLDRKGVALRYLQEIRNEAHRFAVAYHHLLRTKNQKG